MSCHKLISDSDIQTIFELDDIITEVICTSECPDINTKVAHIHIYNKEDSLITDTNYKCEHNTNYICRVYHAKKKLKNSDKIAKIAEHKLLVLKKEYRNRKISKFLKENEDRIYKKNDIKQVWLEAIWDGIITWNRIGYIFVDPSIENDLISHWRRYVIDKFILEESDYQKLMKVNKLADIPKRYLLPKDSKIEPFYEWIKNFSDKIRLAEMYRDIS